MSNSGDRSNAGKNTATRVADDAPRYHGGEEEEAVRWRKGASIKYVRRFFGFFDPLPPLVRKFTQPRLLSLSTTSAFGPTPPLPLSAYVLNGSPLTAFFSEIRTFGQLGQ